MANGLLNQFDRWKPGESKGLIDPNWAGAPRGSGTQDPRAVDPLLWSTGARIAAPAIIRAPSLVRQGADEIVTAAGDAVNLGRTLVRQFPKHVQIGKDILTGELLKGQLKRTLEKVTDKDKGDLTEAPQDAKSAEDAWDKILAGIDDIDEEELDRQLIEAGKNPEDVVSKALKRISTQEGDITLSPDRFYPNDTTPTYTLHEDYRVTDEDAHKTKYWPLQNPASLIREWELLDNASARNRVDKYLNLLFNVGDAAVIKEWEFETEESAWLDRSLPSDSEYAIRRSIDRGVKHGTGEVDYFIELARKKLNNVIWDVENGYIDRAVKDFLSIQDSIERTMEEDERMPPHDESGLTFHPLVERSIPHLKTFGDLMNLHVRIGQYNTIKDVVDDQRRQSNEYSKLESELAKVRSLMIEVDPIAYKDLDRALIKLREKILDYKPFPGMDEKNVLPTVDQLVDIFPPDEVGTVEHGEFWTEIPGKGSLSAKDVRFLDRTKELSSRGYDWLMEKVRAQEASQEEADLLYSLMTMEELPED